MAHFEYEIICKSLVMAKLSLSLIYCSDNDTSDLQEEAEYLMEMYINSLLANIQSPSKEVL